MKRYSLASLAIFLLPSVVSAAIYSADFESEVLYPGPRIAGSDGWVTNESSSSSTNFLAFWNTDFAAGFGGLLAKPVNSPATLRRSITSSLIGSLGLSFEFAIIDSNNTSPSRDTFTVGLMNSGANLFFIEFKPRDQSATPASGPDAIWDLFYSVNGGPSVSLTQGVLEGATYGFNLSLSPNGASTNFEITVDGSTAEVRNGTFAMNPLTAVTEFGFEWTPTTSPATAGSNYFVFDDILVVPEPSSAMLLGLAAFGFVTRRKRA